MKQVTGRVTIVQEQRFRLTLPTGQSYLLALHHAANVAPEDLRTFQHERTDVVVEYSGDPGLASASAHRVCAA
jgi:hypothetical protein